MGYIRNKTEEVTGYQEAAPYTSTIDLQCDFVMVYGTDETMPKRIREFKEKGYVVHLMTGIAWGEYKGYLYGQWDGENHWEDSQMDEHGNHISHGVDVPYMVPTISFTNYLTEKLKVAVDSGVEAIHLEEPEFWDYSGYSKSFKREYELCYREPWRPQHSDLNVRYKSAKLKAKLYARALTRISESLKEYAYKKYNRILRIYVPTHSLLNYTQWKIMSPESNLIDITSLDGYIAQIWTGTSRTINVYKSILKERTFETAYLEYGVMQELVKGTNKKMWFLHDPIEDNPDYTWENYRVNYTETLVASLLHPYIHTYEICPWPNRVFNGIYPKYKDGTPRENAMPIPEDYRTFLCSMIQMLGDMKQSDIEFLSFKSNIGLFLSDSGLFQRSYSKDIINLDENNEIDVLMKTKEALLDDTLCSKILSNEDYEHKFIESLAFPNFYGLSLPLIKNGAPLRTVQLDNLKRFPNYLNEFNTLILSYELIKPESPDINNAISNWVQHGGFLFYIGDDSDPYNKISGWWNEKSSYNSPSQHLFETLGLQRDCKDGVYPVKNGNVMVWRIKPSQLCISEKLSSEYTQKVRYLLKLQGINWNFTNNISVRRGPYIISTQMDESLSESTTYEGVFANMLTTNYEIIRKKIILPGENTILYDIEKIADATAIIGSSVRIISLYDNETFTLVVKGADKLQANIRLRLSKQLASLKAKDSKNKDVKVDLSYCNLSNSHLLAFKSEGNEIAITGTYL
ncbi:MAG: hypothetical protein ACK5LT_00340 [Lachnospirales bacterium]